MRDGILGQPIWIIYRGDGFRPIRYKVDHKGVTWIQGSPTVGGPTCWSPESALTCTRGAT